MGAGFAGLTAACALAQRGWSVRVHERGERLRTTGAGIYIYENGLRVLTAVGAYDAAVKDKVATLINVQSSRQFLTNTFPPGAQPRNIEPGVTAYSH